jgi:AraC-like DNA-binding protein
MPVSAREATGPAAPERQVFSTAGLPATRRIERWESHNAAALIGLDVHADGPLEATEVNVRLPQVRLARVRGSAHAVERTSAVIGRCPADSIAVYLTLRGDASFTGADGTRELRPGDALVCATDRPFARGFARGLEELVVTVPCAALLRRAPISPASTPATARFAAAEAGPGGPLAGTGQYARALARLAGRATGPGPAPPPDEGTLLDLVAVLAAGRDAAPAAAHRAAAHCYIDEHLTSPGLGAEQIAAAVGISERQLSRVFAADGTSVPRHVLARRLQLAYGLLAAEATGTAESVADVAARCGFTSATYFSHVFRRHFGLRASDVRGQFGSPVHRPLALGFSFPPSHGPVVGPFPGGGNNHKPAEDGRRRAGPGPGEGCAATCLPSTTDSPRRKSPPVRRSRPTC